MKDKVVSKVYITFHQEHNNISWANLWDTCKEKWIDCLSLSKWLYDRDLCYIDYVNVWALNQWWYNHNTKFIVKSKNELSRSSETETNLHG